MIYISDTNDGLTAIEDVMNLQGISIESALMLGDIIEIEDSANLSSTFNDLEL